jgi:anti-sigma factor RsiW
VSALVDGEVGDERHRAAATHVASCHICTALADDYRAIGRQLAGGYQLTPAHLADKIRARLAAEADTARDTRRPDWRRWARQAAVLVLACGLSAFMTWHLTQLSAQNAGRVDFAPAVKDLTAEGFALAGGRLDLVESHEQVVDVRARHSHEQDAVDHAHVPSVQVGKSVPIAAPRRLDNRSVRRRRFLDGS